MERQADLGTGTHIGRWGSKASRVDDLCHAAGAWARWRVWSDVPHEIVGPAHVSRLL